MPNITVARTGELLQALFRILQKYPDGLRARDALQTLRDKMKLTPYEAGTYKSGAPRFDKIVRWATVDCVKAGWMIKEEGRWYLTPVGIDALKKYPAPAEFYGEAMALYRKWKKLQPQPEDAVPEEEIEGEEPSEQTATLTLETAQEQARDEIVAYLLAMDPFEFQKLVGALLTAMGYHVAWIAKPGKDHGVDLLAYPDPLGTRTPRIKVQVKRQQTPVGAPDVSSFMGNLGSEEVGIFVSTGGFTNDATVKARTDKQHRVTLVDVDRFVRLWTEHYTKLDDIARRRLPIQPVHFLAPEG